MLPFSLGFIYLLLMTGWTSSSVPENILIYFSSTPNGFPSHAELRPKIFIWPTKWRHYASGSTTYYSLPCLFCFNHTVPLTFPQGCQTHSSFGASAYIAWSALTSLSLDICPLSLLFWSLLNQQPISGTFSGYFISNNNANPTPNAPFLHFLNYFPQENSSLSDILYILLIYCLSPPTKMQAPCGQGAVLFCFYYCIHAGSPVPRPAPEPQEERNKYLLKEQKNEEERKDREKRYYSYPLTVSFHYSLYFLSLFLPVPPLQNILLHPATSVSPHSPS